MKLLKIIIIIFIIYFIRRFIQMYKALKKIQEQHNAPENTSVPKEKNEDVVEVDFEVID